jgi:hypothetical protein
MNLSARIFKSPEIQAVLKILDEAERSFDSPAFCVVKEHIRAGISKFPSNVVRNVKESSSPRRIGYLMIANTAGDELESGEHHMYRGALNPLGYGPELLKIYNSALDELVRMGCVSEKEAEENRAGLRENIRSVG